MVLLVSLFHAVVKAWQQYYCERKGGVHFVWQLGCYSHACKSWVLLLLLERAFLSLSCLTFWRFGILGLCCFVCWVFFPLFLFPSEQAEKPFQVTAGIICSLVILSMRIGLRACGSLPEKTKKSLLFNIPWY